MTNFYLIWWHIGLNVSFFYIVFYLAMLCVEIITCLSIHFFIFVDKTLKMKSMRKKHQRDSAVLSFRKQAVNRPNVL